jgi:hypothetical protein
MRVIEMLMFIDSEDYRDIDEDIDEDIDGY